MEDPILNGLIEENLCKQHNVRITKFPGATVDDLNYHIHPILRKKPKHINIHIGTNDTTRSTILDKLLKPKMISETKIDNSFPISQFTMTGYSISSRLDRTSHGGGILLFVRQYIPCKIIKTDCDADFEGIFVEINL